MLLFGNVDGATEGEQGFVLLDPRWGDIALNTGNRRVRVIVGRRGSGKSRYIRAMEREASRHQGDGLMVFPQRDESVWITQLRWFHRTYPESHERIEAWRRLWTCAIYASLASFLLNFQPPAGATIRLRPEDREFFEKFCANYLGRQTASFPIVAALNHFLDRYQHRGRLDSFIGDSLWTEVEDRILKTVSTTTPIGCYIDTLDETFAASPAAATDCQVGLLQCMLRKFLDPHVNNRFHLVVTVRDTIFAALMQGEHGPRYSSDVIRCLDWTDEAASHFLLEKVSMLPAKARALPNEKNNPVKSWLGVDVVSNGMRKGREEPVLDLIVRHTRFLPRDIIEIGNAVAQYVERRLAENLTVQPEVIPQIVMDEARLLSDKAIETATDHLLALDPDHARTAVANGFRQTLIQAINKIFIPALEQERFPKAILDYADEAFIKAVSGWQPKVDWRVINVSEVLWQHGLIGFEDRSGPTPVAKYFSSTKSLRAHVGGTLPEAEYYYLHSALLREDRTVIAAIPPVVEAATLE